MGNYIMSDFAKSIGAVPVGDEDDFAKSIGAIPLDDVSMAESVARGTVQGLSMGFADEGTGAAEAAYKGLFGDDKLADFVANYKKYRDESRKDYDAAEKANPNSYLGGNIAGGVASAFIPGLGALNAAKGAKLWATIGKGALQGGIAGAGYSEAGTLGGDVTNAAIGAGLGGAFGGAGYGVAKGIGAGAKKVGDAMSANRGIGEKAATLGKALTSGAAKGAKEGAEGLPTGLDWAGSAHGAVKGAISEVKATASGLKEFGEVAKAAREVIASSGDDAAEAILKASDDDVVAAALMADGDNPVKAYFVQKSAMLSPGAHSSDDYAKVMSLPSEARQSARTFNPRDAAKEITPEVDAVEGLFKKARSERFNQLQDAARQQFDPKAVNAVVGSIGDALEDTTKLKSIPSSVTSTLEDVQQMILEGNGTRLQKLQPGAIEGASVGEQFNRLQKARELLDSKIKWSSTNGEGQAESLLRGVRDSIDDALKTSAEKVEADALWSASKRLEGEFFDATKFGKAGARDIDESKIAKLLGKTDTGVRFSETLQKMKAFAEREDLSPEFRGEMAKVIKSFEDKIGTMDQKRAIDTLRFKNGPSSPAIERLQSISNKNGLLGDAINAPAGFLNSIDEFHKFIKTKTGRPFSDLSAKEKVGSATFLKWWRGNPDASQEAVDQMFKKLIKDPTTPVFTVDIWPEAKVGAAPAVVNKARKKIEK